MSRNSVTFERHLFRTFFWRVVNFEFYLSKKNQFAVRQLSQKLPMLHHFRILSRNNWYFPRETSASLPKLHSTCPAEKILYTFFLSFSDFQRKMLGLQAKKIAILSKLPSSWSKGFFAGIVFRNSSNLLLSSSASEQKTFRLSTKTVQ